MKNPYLIQLQNQVKKGNNVFIAHNATVIGMVNLANDVSIWYNTVIRADHDTINIGNRTNIQDGVIMHVDPFAPITIGEDNVIGHAAIIHGATIGNNNLIGMRSTILNHANIGNYCIIGAHTLVTENMQIPDFSMVLGTPGKIIKTLPPQIIDKIKLGVQAYLHEAKKYIESSTLNN